jgi:hypothetical protein
MQLSIGTIGIILVLIIAIVYFSIKYYYTAGKIHVFEEGPIDLSKPSVVIESDETKDILQSKNGSTISVFIKIDGIDKSGTYDGTPINIFEQPGCWAFQYVPSNNSNPTPTYRFSMQTIDANGAQGSEIIALPMFPEQKWTYFTILREGRRFDILYNKNIVGSSYLINYPKVQTQATRIGNEAMRGQAAFVNGADRRYTFEEVADEWAARADTRGKPYLPTESILPTFGCPAGLFCFRGISGPNDMQKYWSSPYA